MAVSINTAYADLWHRVGGKAVANMAQEFGVNTNAACITAMCGKTLAMQDEAGVALGQASLTVVEQATMLATIDNGGVYHSAHIIASIGQNSQNNAPPIAIKVTSYPVFSSDPTVNKNEAIAGAVRDVGGRRAVRHRAGRRHEQRPGDHRQDRNHEQRPVGVLHRRHPEPGPGRRAVHQPAGHRATRRWTCSAGFPRAASAAPGRPRSGTPTPRTCSSRSGSSRSPPRSSPARPGTRSRRTCVTSARSTRSTTTARTATGTATDGTRPPPPPSPVIRSS